MTLKFFYNGIKGADGKLQKAWYSDGALLKHPAGTITIYAREYGRFGAEVRAAFAVENDTDTMTDYFDKDRIRVLPTDEHYKAVAAAMAKQKAHADKRAANAAKKAAAAALDDFNYVGSRHHY